MTVIIRWGLASIPILFTLIGLGFMCRTNCVPAIKSKQRHNLHLHGVVS